MSRNLHPYNVPNADVAKVLEDAADLYESEKIEWCTRSWAKNTDGAISACAEGALLLARGYNWATVFNSSRELFSTDLLAHAAHDSLLDHLNEGQAVKLGSVYHWNDKVAGVRTRVELVDGTTVLSRISPAEAKAEVIEAMKETAKDLRNSEGNS
jgi:hypothetical protein